MTLSNQELVEKFYEANKHLYPHMNLEEMKLCCNTPFLFVRKEMESGELNTVRLKYFGTFLTYPKRVEHILIRMEEQFKNLTLSAKTYFNKKAMIDKYLRKHEA